MEFGPLKSAIDLLEFLDLGLTRSGSSLGHHLVFSSLCHHLDFSSFCHQRVCAIMWIFADVCKAIFWIFHLMSLRVTVPALCLTWISFPLALLAADAANSTEFNDSLAGCWANLRTDPRVSIRSYAHSQPIRRIGVAPAALHPFVSVKIKSIVSV